MDNKANDSGSDPIEKLLGNFTQTLGVFMYTIISKPVRFLLVATFCMFLGYLCFIVFPKSYEAKFSLIVKSLPNSLVLEKLEKYQEMLKHRNYQSLSSKLKLSADKVSKIRKIEFVNLSDAFTDYYRDSLATSYPFSIKLRVRDTSIFDSVQLAISNSLVEDELSKMAIFERRKLLTEKLESVKIQIIVMDSIKHLLMVSLKKQDSGKSGNVVLNSLSMGDLFDQINTLGANRVLLENSLSTNFGLKTISNIEKGSSDEYPQLIIFVLAGLLFSFPLHFFLFGPNKQ